MTHIAKNKDYFICLVCTDKASFVFDKPVVWSTAKSILMSSCSTQISHAVILMNLFDVWRSVAGPMISLMVLSYSKLINLTSDFFQTRNALTYSVQY